jgi:type II secretory pathway pseudopilin PulG
MNVLAKLRPGAFGLVILGLLLSTVATSMFKATGGSASTSNTKAAVNTAQAPATDGESDTDATQEPEQVELTFHEYAIETEISNLDKLVRTAARERLDAGVTADQVKGSLAALADQPPTPETTARKLYLLRALRTLEDSEPLPAVEAVESPTVEGYKDAIGAD